VGDQVWMWRSLDPILSIPIYIHYIYLYLDIKLDLIWVALLCCLRQGFYIANEVLNRSCQFWCLIYYINGVLRFCVL